MDLVRLISYIGDHGYVTLFTLVLSSVALGVLQALRDKTFKAQALADFAEKYGYQIGVYAVADLLLQNSAMATLVLGAIVVSLTSDILEKILAFFPQLEGKLPSILTKRDK